MNPVKRHRVVRQTVASVGETDQYSRPAIESAENEGWPQQWPAAELARLLHLPVALRSHLRRENRKASLC